MNFFEFYNQVNKFNEEKSFIIEYEKFNKIFTECVILETRLGRVRIDNISLACRDFNTFMNDTLNTNFDYAEILRKLVYSKTRGIRNPAEYLTEVMTSISIDVNNNKNNIKDHMLSIISGKNPLTNEPIPPEKIENQLLSFVNSIIQQRLKRVNSEIKSREKPFRYAPEGLSQSNLEYEGQEDSDETISTRIDKDQEIAEKTPKTKELSSNDKWKRRTVFSKYVENELELMKSYKEFSVLDMDDPNAEEKIVDSDSLRHYKPTDPKDTNVEDYNDFEVGDIVYCINKNNISRVKILEEKGLKSQNKTTIEKLEIAKIILAKREDEQAQIDDNQSGFDDIIAGDNKDKIPGIHKLIQRPNSKEMLEYIVNICKEIGIDCSPQRAQLATKELIIAANRAAKKFHMAFPERLKQMSKIYRIDAKAQ